MTIQLNRHQIVFILFVMIVLISCIDWGLPDQYRMELLTSNSHITSEQLKLISTDRKQYYNHLNRLRERRVKNLQSGKQIDFFSKPKIGKNERNYSQIEKRTFLRSYILGGSAPDEREPYSALSQINLKKFNFELKSIYGGAFVYPIGVLIFCLKSLGYIEVTKDLSKYVNNPKSIARMYVCGRSLNVLAFLGTIILIALLGNNFYGFSCGTTGMLIYAFSPYALNHSVITKPHIYAAFWVVFGLFLLISYCINKSKLSLILSSICCGIASGSIYPSVICLLMYPVLIFDKDNIKQSIKLIATPIIISIIIVLITNPYFLIKPLAIWVKFLYVGSGNGLGYIFSITKIKNYLLSFLCVTNCFPFGLLGVMFCFKEIKGDDSVLKRLSLLFLLWLVILSLILPNVRVSMFTMPLLCVLTSAGIYKMLSGKKLSKRIVFILFILFIPGIIFFVTFSYCTINHNRHNKSMKEWIQTLKPDDSIGVFGSLSPVHIPAFPFLNRSIINMSTINMVNKKQLPQYIIIGNYTSVMPKKWHSLSLKKHYQLIKSCGVFQGNYILQKLINMNLSRKGAFIYMKRPS